MLKKYRYYLGGLIVVVLLLIIIGMQSRNGEGSSIYTYPKKGIFEVSVTTSGELEANNSVKVFGPSDLGRANVWNIKIIDIVPEGTSVKKGDYVAQLDRTSISEKINNFQLEVNNLLGEVTNSKMDTAIELQQARNNLENLKSAMFEAQLEVEKSIYEPPVVIKQTESAYQRASRDYEQALQGYTLSQRKAAAKVQASIFKHQQAEQEIAFLYALVNNLTIFAPEDGMVIYRKDNMGEKAGKDASVDAWNPIVAELPDMNRMSSKTFVNEVDIQKIRNNQEVEVSFDAFPSKNIKGHITEVANVGETIFGGNAKVFLVKIALEQSDPEIKPGMTTSNRIIVSSAADVLYVPIETIFSQGDSLDYVYVSKKFSIEKREVLLGERNNMDVIVKSGITSNEKLLFSPPKNCDDIEIVYLKSNKSSEESLATNAIE